MLRTIIIIAALWFMLDVASQEFVLQVFAPIDDDLWSGIASSIRGATQ